MGQMNKTIQISILALLISIGAFSQGLIRPNRPTVTLDASTGFITINELNAGFGLGGVTTPYSKSFFGFTTVNGYQVNETFLAGAGTGILLYNDGPMIPLFLEFRLRILIDKYTPYLSGAGGLLLNPRDFNGGTRMFLTPSAGVRYTMNRNLGFTLSAGLQIQIGSNAGRSGFLNIKTGVVYKF